MIIKGIVKVKYNFEYCITVPTSYRSLRMCSRHCVNPVNRQRAALCSLLWWPEMSVCLSPYKNAVWNKSKDTVLSLYLFFLDFHESLNPCQACFSVALISPSHIALAIKPDAFSHQNVSGESLSCPDTLLPSAFTVVTLSWEVDVKWCLHHCWQISKSIYFVAFPKLLSWWHTSGHYFWPCTSVHILGLEGILSGPGLLL